MATASTDRAATIRAIEAAARRYAAASARTDQLAADAAPLTLSTCEYNFLNLLRLHGPLSPGELGRLTGLTSGTTTGVVDRLENAGYVVRERSTTDRRKVRVSLDEARLAAAEDARARRLAPVLAGRSEADLAVIADFLTALADAESAATGRPGR
ncbi:MarR family winged helix-turn-helix transcriptional regulator [Nocardia thailandica]